MSFPRRIHELSSQKWINDYVTAFKKININKDIERMGDGKISQYWFEIPADVKSIRDLKKLLKTFFKITSSFELTLRESKGYILHDGFPPDFKKHDTIYIVPTAHMNDNVAIADDLIGIVRGVSSMEVDDGRKRSISGQEVILKDESFKKKKHEFEASTPKDMIWEKVNELQKTESLNENEIEISPVPSNGIIIENQYETPMTRNDFEIYTDCDSEIIIIPESPSTEVSSSHQKDEAQITTESSSNQGQDEEQTTNESSSHQKDEEKITTESSSNQDQDEEESSAVTETGETDEMVMTLQETVNTDSWVTYVSMENVVSQDHQMEIEGEDESKLNESTPIIGEEENEEEEEGTKVDWIFQFSQHIAGKNSPTILQKRVPQAPENDLKTKKSKSDPPTPTSPIEQNSLIRSFSEPPMRNKVRRDSFIPSLSLAKPIVDLQKLVHITGDGWFSPIKYISEIRIHSWIKFSLPTETGASAGAKNYKVLNVDVERGTFTATPFHEERMTNPLSADLIKFNFNEILNPLIHVSKFPKEEEEEEEDDDNNEESF